MTDKTAEMDGFADIPAAERRRIMRQSEEDNRKGILRNHFRGRETQETDDEG